MRAGALSLRPSRKAIVLFLFSRTNAPELFALTIFELGWKTLLFPPFNVSWKRNPLIRVTSSLTFLPAPPSVCVFFYPYSLPRFFFNLFFFRLPYVVSRQILFFVSQIECHYFPSLLSYFSLLFIIPHTNLTFRRTDVAFVIAAAFFGFATPHPSVILSQYDFFGCFFFFFFHYFRFGRETSLWWQWWARDKFCRQFPVPKTL